METLSLFSTTVPELRTLAKPVVGRKYNVPDGGVFMFAPSDKVSTDNTGTVVVNQNGDRFKRVSADGVTVELDWFDVDGVGGNIAAQLAIDSLNGFGQLNLPARTIDFNEGFVGGVKMPTDAKGIIVQGKGASTVIRASIGCPRGFDCDGSPLVGVVKNYTNIYLTMYQLDANNLTGANVGAARPVVTTVTGTGAYINVNIGDNASYIQSGLVFLPNANTGTSKGTYRPFQKVSGTTSIQIKLNNGETLLAGDIVKGALVGHVIFGNRGDNGLNTNLGTSLNIQNVTYNNINITNVNAYNIATEDALGNYFETSTKRVGVDLNCAPVPGYTGTLFATNINIIQVKLDGGQGGFGVYGSGNGSNPVKAFFDNIYVSDCSHKTNNIPTYAYNCWNYFFGNTGWGNKLIVQRCFGEGSSDVGVETDAWMDAKIIDCTLNNDLNTFVSINYNYPAETIDGAPATTITSAIIGTDTTVSLATVPAGVSNTGYLGIENELVYYSINPGTTNLTILRGLNGTPGVAHASGVVATFAQLEKQSVKYINCRVNSTLVPNPEPIKAWRQVKNGILPAPRMFIQDCFYNRTSPYLFSDGECVAVETSSLQTSINGLQVNISGIVNTTSNSLVGKAFYFNNPNYITGLPRHDVSLNRLTGTISGTLDNGASNKSAFHAIVLNFGSYFLNWHDINIGMKLANTTMDQTIGMRFGFNANTVNGTITKYKFSSIGDGRPVPISINSATTISKLEIDDLDCSDLNYTVTSDNGNYAPVVNGGANPNVFIGKVKPPDIATTPIASKFARGIPVTANYTAKLDDRFLQVNTSAARTIQLPKVNTGGSVNANQKKRLLISDITLTAATNNITITPFAGETINGSTSNVLINRNGGAIELTTIAGGWIINYYSPALTDGRYVTLDSTTQDIVGTKRFAGGTLMVNGAAGTGRDFTFATTNVSRWIQRITSDAESGANAGSKFQLLARTDAGGSLFTVFEADRATGIMTFPQGISNIGATTYAATGNGTATITIPHGKTGVSATSRVFVTPKNAASAPSVLFATITSTNVVLTYTGTVPVNAASLSYDISIFI